MPYTIDRTPLGHDAVPDFSNAPTGVGTILAVIPHKADAEPGRWTIIGWRWVGTNGWVDQDAAGICYATGTAYYPPSENCILCGETLNDCTCED